MFTDTAAAKVRFPVVGDWGASTPLGWQYQVKVADAMNQWCRQEACDFVISTGDNIYMNGAESPNDSRFEDRWRKVYDGEAIKNLTW